MKKHPMQPIVKDDDGVVRFQGNAIVEFLYNTSKNKLNELAAMPFSRQDRTQFAQLLGYSISGFEELPYVTDVDAIKARTEADKLKSRKKKA